MNKLILLIFPILLMSNKCDKESTSDDNKDPAVVSLVGTYDSACVVNGADSKLAIIDITSSAAELKITDFKNDTTCTSGAKKSETRYTFDSYTYANDDLRLIRLGAFYTPFNATEITTFNNNSECGFTNWSSGVEKALIGLNPCFIKVSVGNSKTYTVQKSGDDLHFSGWTFTNFIKR